MRSNIRPWAWLFASALAAFGAIVFARVVQGFWQTVQDTAALLPDAPRPSRDQASSNASPAAALRNPQRSSGALRESQASLAESAAAACRSDMRLLASVVNADSPSRSLAAMRLPEGTRVMHVGERVGEATLVELDARRAYLRGEDGATCILRVTPEARTARPKLAPARPPVPKSRVSAQELAAGIRHVGGDNYVVTRELLLRALGDASLVRRAGRFRIVKRDGRVEGLQALATPPHSALAQLGIQKGDIVRKLNGLDLANAGNALEALSLLRSQSKFSLALTRGSTARTLNYEVE